MILSSKKTILLVEDEVLLAALERRTLEKEGYAVVTAETGEKALELVESDPCLDLVIMDINLGKGLDGTSTAKRILEKRELPLVFLTSHTEADVVEKTESISSYGYIIKNSGENVMSTSIRMAFKLFEARTRERETTEAFRASELRYKTLFTEMLEGFTLLEVVRDRRGSPCDYRFLDLNPAFEAMVQLKKAELIGKRALDILPDTAPILLERCGQVASTGQSLVFENFLPDLRRHFRVVAYSPVLGQIALLFSDCGGQRQDYSPGN